jgi:hypothetical protein
VKPAQLALMARTRGEFDFVTIQKDEEKEIEGEKKNIEEENEKVYEA